MTPILSITGSDNSGWSGLQLDIRTITEMGGHALTAATCIVMQDRNSVSEIIDFSCDLINRQVVDIISNSRPKAVKVGLVRTAESVKAVAKEISGCRNIVLAPGIMSSGGRLLVGDEAIRCIVNHLMPKARLLILRQAEAEKILSSSIQTDKDMINACQTFVDMGAEYVMLRGGRITEGRVTALLYGQDTQQFFSSYNIEGWQQHGVGGALSTAIATRMGMGDDVYEAIRSAHEFVHSRIVYSIQKDSKRMRPADIYNAFMNLLTDNYKKAHDVAFYADKLSITTRYLSQITHDTVSKSPKQIIADYLLLEARQMLENSRLSVKEISDELGFSTTALFCKFFKQQQGVTPSDYRNSVE